MKETQNNIGSEKMVRGSLLAKAVSNLDAYLEQPGETALREHNIDVMQSLRDFFAQGKTAGYVSEPTGSGKTYLAAELTKVLGMRTAILSPTQTILSQNGKVLRRVAPELEVSDYYTHSKGTSGSVINTTYQSLPTLLKQLQTGNGLKPEDIELLICDETHMALGELRHALFRRLPNALKIGLTATPYFTPLQGYEKRGMVDPHEEWVSLFKDNIHEMTLEEGIERGILSDLSVHLIRTGITVDNIEINGGEYNQAELRKYLNRESRKALVLGMVAGIESIPKGVDLTNEQREEIETIHEKIKGKRTAIFGHSIKFIEEVAHDLQNAGINAKAVHGKVKNDIRQDIFSEHKEAETQVVLGVDLLRLGWDSPETEVGIYTAPTRSSIKAIQELGRILRLSPESGKEKATAIQLYDRFKFFSQAPVLIPDIFDPYFIKRGSQTGEEKRPRIHKDKTTNPKISFSGMDIDTILREIETIDILKQRFKTSSIVEMAQVIDQIIMDVHSELQVGDNGDAGKDLPPPTLMELLKELSSAIPRVAVVKQEEAIQAIASLDTNISEAGKKVIIFTNSGTILNAIEQFLKDEGTIENDDILQAAILEVLERFARSGANDRISQNIYFDAKRGAMKYVAAKHEVQVSWVNADLIPNLTQLQKAFRGNSHDEPQQTDVDEFMIKSAKNGGQPSEDSIQDRVKAEQHLVFDSNFQTANNTLISEGNSIILREAIIKALNKLSKREADIIKLRYGLGDEMPRSLNEVGEVMKLSRERISQIEIDAIRKLRHPVITRKIRDFADAQEKMEPILEPYPEWDEPKSEEQKESKSKSKTIGELLAEFESPKVTTSQKMPHFDKYKLRIFRPDTNFTVSINPWARKATKLFNSVNIDITPVRLTYKMEHINLSGYAQLVRDIYLGFNNNKSNRDYRIISGVNAFAKQITEAKPKTRYSPSISIIDDMLSTLPRELFDVVCRRYELNQKSRHGFASSGQDAIYAVIALESDQSREDVKKRINKAMQVLRHPSRSMRLSELIDRME